MKLIFVAFNTTHIVYVYGTHPALNFELARRYISNPDLVLRLKLGAPLTKYNRDAFYTQGE